MSMPITSAQARALQPLPVQAASTRQADAATTPATASQDTATFNTLGRSLVGAGLGFALGAGFSVATGQPGALVTGALWGATGALALAYGEHQAETKGSNHVTASALAGAVGIGLVTGLRSGMPAGRTPTEKMACFAVAALGGALLGQVTWGLTSLATNPQDGFLPKQR